MIPAGLVALALLAACTSDGTLAPTDAPSVPPASIGGGDGASGELEVMIASALERAAQDTGAALDEITVVSADQVTWSDGSIGCHQEGMAYTQALVPGFRVIIEVEGQQLHYHAGSDGQFFQCANPMEPIDGAVDR